MASLSLDDSLGGRPVATVKGGSFDKEILYLNEKPPLESKAKAPKQEINFSRYQNELKGLKARDKIAAFQKIEEAYNKGLTVDSLVGVADNVKALYDKILKDTKLGKTVEIPMNSFFQLIPSTDPKKRGIWYIAGMSGSGKSFVANMIAENYKKLFPEREVFLVTKNEADDPTLQKSKAKIKRLDPNTFVDDIPDMHEFDDSLVIFDDYDTFDAPLDGIIHKLIDDIASMGRKTNISMVNCTHFLTNYKKTRLLLCEAQHFVIYPHGASMHALKYLLGTHVGMSKKQIEEIKEMNSRWVCISKTFPAYIVGEHCAKLLN